MMDTTIWFGDSEALTRMQILEQGLQQSGRWAELLLQYQAFSNSADSEPSATDFESYGPVAVVPLKGPLHSRETFMTWLTGAEVYDRWTQKIVAAASHPNTKALVIDADTPGGAVAGMADAANAVERIVASGTPVYAYVSGSLSSAGYYTLAPATHIMANPTSHIGSIGAMASARSYVKAMEKDGVETRIFRSGSLKGVGGPEEPLSESAAAMIQGHIDELGHVFLQHVAQHRNIPLPLVTERFQSGKVFSASEALQLGLIDGFTTLSDLVSGLILSFQSSPRHQPASRVAL